MKYTKFLFTLLVTSQIFFSANAQKLPKNENSLYTAGHASAFIGGLYDAFYPYKQLLQHGDFGLGAPDQLDGELLILDGKIYQTQASGKTFEIKEGYTPFAVVNFFRPERNVVTLATNKTKDQLYAFLDSILPNQNAIYAIRIKGSFAQIKTRAFPKVTQKPYAPLASMLALQRFFSFNQIQGDLVGYRIPNYMEGSNISGYHFHFLSADKQAGGHIIELMTGGITIEIDELAAFTVALPQTDDFRKFDFKKDRRAEVKKVENGN
ncbi:MAG: acetolactate decarboxylase [Bacteroidota bacterium]